MQRGARHMSSFSKHGLGIHWSVARNGVDLLALDDSTIWKIKKPKISHWQESRLQINHETACNIERFLTLSPVHNFNQQVWTIPENGAGLVSLSTEMSGAEQSASTKQFNSPTAAKATETLIEELVKI